MDQPPVSPDQKAEMGLRLLKEAVLDRLEQCKEGARNSELASFLNLKCSHQGQQQDYLTYSVLGILIDEGKVRKIKQNNRAIYVRNNESS